MGGQREREEEGRNYLSHQCALDRPWGQSKRPPPVSALRAAVVRVVCLVVHHQLIVHKVEAVGLRLIWVQDHLPDCKQTHNHQRSLSNSGQQTKGLCP